MAPSITQHATQLRNDYLNMLSNKSERDISLSLFGGLEPEGSAAAMDSALAFEQGAVANDFDSFFSSLSSSDVTPELTSAMPASAPASRSSSGTRAPDTSASAFTTASLHMSPHDTPGLSFSPTSPNWMLDEFGSPDTPAHNVLGLGVGVGVGETGLEGLGAEMSLGLDMPLFGFAPEAKDVNTAVSATAASSSSNTAKTIVDPSALGLGNIRPSADPVTVMAAARTPATPAMQLIDNDEEMFSPAGRPLRSSRAVSSGATGHRKNLAPEALLDLEAPTQTRKYKGPSATSKKANPAFAVTIRQKRKATVAELSDNEDEDEDQELEPVNGGTLEDEIEAKRRQNTLAARRSRKRKLEHVRGLEDQIARLIEINGELVRRNEELEGRVREYEGR